MIFASVCCSGCKSTGASNDRNWAPDQAVLPYAEFDGDLVHVHNVRNCKYITADDYIVNHYDKTFDLNELKSVDFIVVPFDTTPMLAHTMLSFGFGAGNQLGVSIEVRREQGEEYSPVQGTMQQYELMYVLGDERDLINLRANFRHDDVFLYPARVTQQQARTLLTDVLKRTNKLRKRPEYYHTLTNNCTTNIVDHVNRISKDRIPDTYQILLAGYSDRLAYTLGLIDTNRSFAETKRRARINEVAYRHRNSPDFSEKIRRF